MKPQNWSFHAPHEPQVLFRCVLIAFVFEAIFLTAMGWHGHWLAHPQQSEGIDESRFIEAQVFEMPAPPRLTTDSPPKPRAAPPEKKISTQVSSRPIDASATQAAPEEENQTESGPKLPPTHGPLAVYAPAPVIPVALQSQEIKTFVTIDFLVNQQGNATARLAFSSGSFELDAIALNTVRKWIFRPAEKDGKPLDSKIRLKIVFIVE